MGRKLNAEQIEQIQRLIDVKLMFHEPRRAPWYDLKGWNLIPIGCAVMVGVATLVFLGGTIPLAIGEWQKVLG